MVRVRVWIVRHGQREDEVEGSDWGKTDASREIWFDPPLTPAGARHAQEVARRFHKFILHKQTSSSTTTFPFSSSSSSSSPFHLIYSSPLLRALQTAEAFAQDVDLKGCHALLAAYRQAHREEENVEGEGKAETVGGLGESQQRRGGKEGEGEEGNERERNKHEEVDLTEESNQS
eukprot:747867-Hanusia_phi.AAC.1